MADVALIGPGAIGLTAALAVELTGRHNLVLCGRRRLDRITVETAGQRFDLRSKLLIDPAEVAGPVDWVLLAVKAHQTAGAAEWLKALCSDTTHVLVLQNGIDHVERVAPFVDRSRVHPVVVRCPAEVVAPGSVQVRDRMRLWVPDDPRTSTALASLFDPGIVQLQPTADIHTEAWSKLCSNAVAGLMALAGRGVEIYRLPEVRRLAMSLASECRAVGVADGARLPDDLPDRIMAHYLDRGPVRGSSILTDRLRNRPLEWAARNGVVQVRGRRHGIPTPVTDVLVPLLMAASADA